MSVGERLKKEISDALANPESSSRKTTKKNEMTTPRVGVWRVMSEKASVNDDMSKGFLVLKLRMAEFHHRKLLLWSPMASASHSQVVGWKAA